MASPLRVPEKLSPEAYLAGENDGQQRHEFVDGVAYAMSGGSDRHGDLAGEFYSALRAARSSGCRAYIHDMKLRIVQGEETTFYYPDVMVSCDPADRASHFRDMPVLIVEVLSLSTERIDRTEKLRAYAGIPSLLEFILADPERPHVELRRRRTGWQPELYGASDTMRLESVALDLDVTGLYAGVDFGARPEG
jgi:Uma2 family endonuclease